ncbi:MAG: hypothetical protein R6X22_02425 [Gemmatimonadota bacterium]
MILAPRLQVAYSQVHWSSTASRFRNPTRVIRWTNSHVSQARNPLTRRDPRTATARRRPIVAIVPLSR